MSSPAEDEMTMPTKAIDLSGDGGCMKEIITAGSSSEKPGTGDHVFVHYVGTLLDGTEFDSSRSRGRMFDFDLGHGAVIKGWDLGVASMTKGERAILTCSADYAYGARGSPPKIPPGATLRFDVELFYWKPAGALTDDGGVIKTVRAPGAGSEVQEGADVRIEWSLTSADDGSALGGSDGAEVSFNIESPPEGVPAGLIIAVRSMAIGELADLQLSSDYSGAGCKATGTVRLAHWCRWEELREAPGLRRKLVQRGDGYETPRPDSVCTLAWSVRASEDENVIIAGSSEAEPLTFALGDGVVLPFIDTSVARMKRGEKLLCDVPARLAWAAPFAELMAPASASVDGAAATVDVMTDSLIFQLHLIDFEQAAATYAMSVEARFVDADAKRSRGNELYAQKRYALAVKKYEAIVRHFDAEGALSEEEKARAYPLKLKAYSNMTACQLAMEQYGEAVKTARKALAIDGDNVKVLFRLGKALRKTKDFAEARAVLRKAIKLEPADKTLRKELERVKKDKEKTRRKQAASFGKMFATSKKKRKTVEAGEAEEAKEEVTEVKASPPSGGGCSCCG